MKPTPEEIARAHRTETTRPSSERAGCPDPGLFAAAASGELDDAARDRFVEHLGDCAECSDEYRSLLPLVEWAEAARPKARILLFPRPAYAVVALAAALILAAGTAFLVSRDSAPPPIERGAEVEAWSVSPRDGAVLSSAPERLVWPAEAGATSYRVSLLDFESTPLWESPPLAEPSVSLPEEIRARLAKGRPHYWRVTVVGEVERRPSPLFRFEIAP
ncbi:MAG TPA: hypothetical protein VGR00_10285 [Thermoanaerobaculia bacterium]|jgi:hypothetical protein|nr:hypothetical protein [Thermoanaerobaculia bacterium]